MAIFKEIDATLAENLLWFAKAEKWPKADSVYTENGKEYRLNHISYMSNHARRRRSYSIYYIVGDSMIRISDHWSKANFFPRSRKFNLGIINPIPLEEDENGNPIKTFGGKEFILDNTTTNRIEARFCGRFSSFFMGGICDIKQLKEEFPRWEFSTKAA